jgi:hypothetical protein
MPLLPAVQPTGTGVATWASAGTTVIDTNRLSPMAPRIVMRTCKPISHTVLWIDFAAALKW